MNNQIRMIMAIIVMFLMTNIALAEGMDLLDQEKKEEVESVQEPTTEPATEPTETTEPAKKPTCPMDTPDGMTTKEYIDFYLKNNKGNAENAWGNAYIDRRCEPDPYQNFERRDAEHYLWSLQDVRSNNYQYLPSLIRTTGYSIFKIGDYYTRTGINKVRKSLGKEEISNTTKPTIDELLWGYKGSQDALFGLD